MTRIRVLALGLLQLLSCLLLVYAEHVVYPVVIKSRSGTSQDVLRVNEEITLNLEKGTILGDSLFFTETVNGEDRHELMDVEQLKESLYQSTEHMASFTLTESEDGLLVRGTVNTTHGIEPLERTANGASRNAHRLFQLPQHDRYDNLVADTLEDIDIVPEERSGGYKYQQQLPAVVTPELYVVVDDSYHKYFRGSKALQVDYVVRLLNCVNMVYMKMVTLKIQLQLVGVRSLHGIEEEVIVVQDGYVHSRKTLANFADYSWQEDFPRPADMFLLLIGRAVADFGKDNRANAMLLGLAYAASVCLRGKNVALAEDPAGTYGGFLTVAHELGHVLGAHHDGTPAQKGSPHPGAPTCPNKGGFIMSTNPSVNGPQTFSNCSEEQIRFVLKRRGKWCWKRETSYYYFHMRKTLASTIPAKVYCRQKYGSLYLSGTYRDCVITCEFRSAPNARMKRNFTQRYVAPFGYSCGRPFQDKICVFKECVPRTRWWIQRDAYHRKFAELLNDTTSSSKGNILVMN